MQSKIHALSWAVLLIAIVHAQDPDTSDPYDDSAPDDTVTTTDTSISSTLSTLSTVTIDSYTTSIATVDDSDVDVTTVYYTLCSDATTSTSASSSSITAGPGALTTVGDDGRITIYRTETTILPHICPEGYGLCGATYTLSEECPCKDEPKTVTENQCPPGFTTTVVECSACADNGGPATVTLTVPDSAGPYASVTPVYGAPITNGTAPASNSDSNGSSAPAAQPSPTAAGRWANSNSTTPTTKPYSPDVKPYVGGAGRMTIDLSAYLSIAGAALVGGLALML